MKLFDKIKEVSNIINGTHQNQINRVALARDVSINNDAQPLSELLFLARDVSVYNSLAKNEGCLIEEMSELIFTIMKQKRTHIPKTGDPLEQRSRFNKALTMELSHVILMCFTLMYEHDIKPEAICTMADDAVRRMYEGGDL